MMRELPSSMHSDFMHWSFLRGVLDGDLFKQKVLAAYEATLEREVEHAFSAFKAVRGGYGVSDLLRGSQYSMDFQAPEEVWDGGNYAFINLHTHRRNYWPFPSLDDFKFLNFVFYLNLCCSHLKTSPLGIVMAPLSSQKGVSLAMFQRVRSLSMEALAEGEEAEAIMEDLSVPEEDASRVMLSFYRRHVLPSFRMGVASYLLERGNLVLQQNAWGEYSFERSQDTLYAVLGQFTSTSFYLEP